MSELNASNLRKEQGNEGPDLVGVTELTSPYYMVPPSGTTAERPQNPEPGTLRFNTDIGRLEYYKGDIIGWETIQGTSPNLNGGARALQMGGTISSTNYNVIDYITVSTLGNMADFGDLTVARASLTSFSSRTRAIAAGGYVTAVNTTMDYVTISSTGNAIDFGDVFNSTHTYAAAGTGDQTRGLFGGGMKLPSPYTVTDDIGYNTIATLANAIDFGNLTDGRSDFAALNSSTRSVWAGGYNIPGVTNIVDYVTTQTLGNASDFGDLVRAGCNNEGGCSNSTRGLISANRSSPATNSIEYITIATLGNATDFGDLPWVGDYGCATSGGTRGIMIQGSGGNAISYVNILSTGNATDFGDQTLATNKYATACSNAHGGL